MEFLNIKRQQLHLYTKVKIVYFNIYFRDYAHFIKRKWAVGLHPPSRSSLKRILVWHRVWARIFHPNLHSLSLSNENTCWVAEMRPFPSLVVLSCWQPTAASVLLIPAQMLPWSWLLLASSLLELAVLQIWSKTSNKNFVPLCSCSHSFSQRALQNRMRNWSATLTTDSTCSNFLNKILNLKKRVKCCALNWPQLLLR